jgi:AHBA synthesis associated protein
MRYAAVVFDLDGVLVDSIEVMRSAFVHAHAAVVGAGTAPFEEYLTHLGRPMPVTLSIMGLPGEIYDAFVLRSAELVHEIPACPGARRMLETLAAAGVPTGVATGKTRPRAEHVLATVGLRDLLDVVVGSDEVEHGKPAPDIVLLAAERLGVPASRVLLVGDSPLDLHSARAAGASTAAALWGQAPAADLAACAPDLTARDCDDLLAQLLA